MFKSGRALIYTNVALLATCIALSISSVLLEKDSLSWMALVFLVAFAVTYGVCAVSSIKRSKMYEHRARHDVLTGLLNRRALNELLNKMLHDDRESKIAVMILDLNKFKIINDTLGHIVGDDLLKQIATRLTTAIRDHDYVSRFGGDEFAFVVTNYGDEENLSVIATRVLRCFEKPFKLASQDMEISASLGIAHTPNHGISSVELIKCADVAMYIAKNEHLGYYVYEKERDVNSVQNMQMRTELRKAIEEDQIFVHYQPKKSLITGRIVGVEALARWKHPKYGMVPPSKFVSMAEQANLIKLLTNLVLSKSMSEFVPLYKRQALQKLSVNISPYNLFHGDLLLCISKDLAKHQIIPADLIVEITETSLHTSNEELIKILLCLDLLGLSISIDDFGTGQSSLIYLRSLPVKEIKIDQSFVGSMLKTQQDYNIVQSLITLAHSVGCLACAEGVEDKQTEDALRSMGCDLVQGYHISKPLSLDDLYRFLKVDKDDN